MPCSESLAGRKGNSLKVGGVSIFSEVLSFFLIFFVLFGLALSYDGIV